MQVTIQSIHWNSLSSLSRITSLVEQLAPDHVVDRFEAASRSRTVPPTLLFEGECRALSDVIGDLLACNLARTLSIVLVPFPICALDDPFDCVEVDWSVSQTGFVHRHVEGHDETLLIDARYLERQWNKRLKAAGVDEACERVSTRSGTDHDVALWLLRQSVERFLPAAHRLRVPLVIEWPERKIEEVEAKVEDLDIDLSLLDGALAYWGEEPESPDGPEIPEVREPKGMEPVYGESGRIGWVAPSENQALIPSIGTVVLHPFSMTSVPNLGALLRTTLEEYELEPANVEVAFSQLPGALAIHLKSLDHADSFALHAHLDSSYADGTVLGGSFGASLSGHIGNTLSEAQQVPTASTVMMKRSGIPSTSVHEGFMYTCERTDEAEDDAPSRRLAQKLGVPWIEFREAVLSPKTEFERNPR